MQGRPCESKVKEQGFLTIGSRAKRETARSSATIGKSAGTAHKFPRVPSVEQRAVSIERIRVEGFTAFNHQLERGQFRGVPGAKDEHMCLIARGTGVKTR